MHTFDNTRVRHVKTGRTGNTGTVEPDGYVPVLWDLNPDDDGDHGPSGARVDDLELVEPTPPLDRHPNADLQAHYDRNADATGHAPDCRRRVVPTMRSDSRAFDPDRCPRCRTLTMAAAR
jgi:hypothetical protein